MGVMFSFDEWVPKRPPRLQKLPLDSGTVHDETPTGFDSVVISTIRTSCRFSRHSFAVVSPIAAMKARPDCVRSGDRSEERRVGKDGGFRRALRHEKK